MYVYKVKLNDGHTALPDQITPDGYLADENGQAELYKQSAAKDKANLFGGTPEKFGKDYVVTTRKILQFDSSKLHPDTVEWAKEKQCFESVGKGGMFVCYGCVFDDILEEGGVPAAIINELRVLSVFCVEADYIQFL